MINLENLTATEAERLAYAEGFTGTAGTSMTGVYQATRTSGTTFTITVRDFEIANGAGFLVALTGTMMGFAFMTQFVSGITSGWLGRFYEPLGGVKFWLLHAAISAACFRVLAACCASRPRKCCAR